MFDKFLHFVKYNNLTILILAVILIAGGGVFAATEPGQAVIGKETTRVEGKDNTLLLAADLGTMNFDFKIEKIEQDVEYYYVTYTFLDLTEIDRAWQYQLTEKTRKVTKKIRQDLGEYLAEEFHQIYLARVKELKEEQAEAAAVGEQKREEVTEYTGLIGKTLDLAAAVFSGYEPVKKRELPSPDFTSPCPSPSQGEGTGSPPPCEGGGATAPDNLTSVYNDYVAAHPDLFAAPPAETATATPAAETATTTASSTSATDSASSPPADTIQPDIVIPIDNLTTATATPAQ
jgi:hypothetical protein